MEEDKLKEVNRPKKSIPKKEVLHDPHFSVASPSSSSSASAPPEAEDGNSGAIAAVVISLLAVLVVIGVGIGVLMRTSVGTRLRARLTSTPYGDIVINDRGQMMGSSTTLESESTSNRNVLA